MSRFRIRFSRKVILAGIIAQLLDSGSALISILRVRCWYAGSTSVSNVQRTLQPSKTWPRGSRLGGVVIASLKSSLKWIPIPFAFGTRFKDTSNPDSLKAFPNCSPIKSDVSVTGNLCSKRTISTGIFPEIACKRSRTSCNSASVKPRGRVRSFSSPNSRSAFAVRFFAAASSSARRSLIILSVQNFPTPANNVPNMQSMANPWNAAFQSSTVQDHILMGSLLILCVSAIVGAAILITQTLRLQFGKRRSALYRRRDIAVLPYLCKRVLRAVKSFKRSVKIQNRLSSLSSFFSRTISQSKSKSVKLLFGSKRGFNRLMRQSRDRKLCPCCTSTIFIAKSS
jgi:hypothetical protein